MSQLHKLGVFWPSLLSPVLVQEITLAALTMDHSMHMDHGHMDHGDMGHGDMDMGQCNMNVSTDRSTSLTFASLLTIS